MNPELEKTKLLLEDKEAEHTRKKEREEQRHKNIMKELAYMAKNKIKLFDRNHVAIVKTCDCKEVGHAMKDHT